MQPGLLAALALALLSPSPAAAVLLRRSAQGVPDYTLAQYNGRFCSGTFVALELTLGQMTQFHLPRNRQPEVLCNKLVQNSTDGTFVVHSCAGGSSGCPAHCDNCHEDLVKHFKLNECNEGWKLVAGAAPEDCTTGHQQCTSKNQVDVGLARWCDRWPTPGTEAKRANTTNATA